MTTISIEAAQAKLDQAQASVEEAKSLLEQVKAQSRPTVLKLAGIDITLQPGERYAGAVLDADGKVKHHLVLLAATPGKALPWKEAMAWAESVGGTLPDRQEQALLYANCKPHLKPEWHWSCETHASDASFAWYCYFNGGGQYVTRKGAAGACVAVAAHDAAAHACGCSAAHGRGAGRGSPPDRQQLLRPAAPGLA